MTTTDSTIWEKYLVRHPEASTNTENFNTLMVSILKQVYKASSYHYKQQNDIFSGAVTTGRSAFLVLLKVLLRLMRMMMSLLPAGRFKKSMVSNLLMVEYFLQCKGTSCSTLESSNSMSLVAGIMARGSAIPLPVEIFSNRSFWSKVKNICLH
jgi:hypothetical protein